MDSPSVATCKASGEMKHNEENKIRKGGWNRQPYRFIRRKLERRWKKNFKIDAIM